MRLFSPQKPRLHALADKLLLLRNRHFIIIDLLTFCITPALALFLRTETTTGIYTWDLVVYTLFALMIRLLIFYAFGLYRRFWRYASSAELSHMVKAMGIATVIIAVGFLVAKVFGFGQLPRSVPFIDALLALILVIGSHASIRMTESWRRSARDNSGVVNVAIMGAGHTGEMIAREIQNNPQLNLCPIAFLDDDPAKHGMHIHNIPVLGDRNQLWQLVERHDIKRVIITMPAAPGREVREVVALCRQIGLKTQIMPGLPELINGKASVNHLRNIQIEDLLRREPIQTDIAAIQELVYGKRVLITGGGGSIGSELCRQILRCKPAQLILIGHGENSIFEISNELQRIQHELQANTQQNGHCASHSIVPVIADLRFTERIHHIFASYRPQIVFHAAAHKHVPLMEAHPSEAITNNILGTKNLLDAAVANQAERFVMISTDKAVNPTSVMGASKRSAEFLVHQAAQQSGRPYMVVRFGNVLGSRGSVVHTFKQQIAAGGPVCVTHPDMVRYFMTIPEAVQLLLQASVLGKGGEVFMLDMGEPVKIVNLARDLIELSGLEVGRDIEIAYTGIRPGEKLFEEMFTPGETYTRTHHAKVLMAANASHCMPNNLNEAIDGLIADAWRNDDKAILRGLKHLLPEFQPPSAANGTAPPQIQPAKPAIVQPLVLEPAMGD